MAAIDYRHPYEICFKTPVGCYRERRFHSNARLVWDTLQAYKRSCSTAGASPEFELRQWAAGVASPLTELELEALARREEAARREEIRAQFRA
jgi:hypothetical protein